MTIQAIPTNYAGHRFKSRTEARWAVFFDQMEIRWEYEPEGVVLPVGWYLPDFWFPEIKMWAEVKPEEIADEAWKKAEQLHLVSGYPVMILNGAPWPQWYEVTDHRKGPEDDDDEEDDVCPWPCHQYFCWGKNVTWWGFGEEWTDASCTVLSPVPQDAEAEEAMRYARAIDLAQ